jgi:hypothetical protein
VGNQNDESASRTHRALLELEAAAGELVDLWALVEVGGCAKRDERLSAEVRVRRAVTALRAARLKR